MNVDIQKLEALGKALIEVNQANSLDWVGLIEDAKLGKTHTEYSLAANPATLLALIAELKRVTQERDEADRLAGEAARTKQELVDYKRRVSSWMEQTTVELGHSRNKPFDEAFNELKAECERLRKLPTAWSEVYQQSEENDELLDQVLQLSNENKALAKNADRYLVLRQADVDTIQNGGLFAGLTPDNLVINGEDLDRRTDAVIEEQRAFAKALLVEAGKADQSDAGSFALEAFAWLYAMPDGRDKQIHLTKQHYPNNWVVNGGYTITPLYTGPVNGEPAGWAYRVKLGAKPTSWRVNLAEPCFSGDPGDIEVMPLYKGEPIAQAPAEQESAPGA